MKKLIALLFALLATPAAAQTIPAGAWGSINYWGVGGLSQVLAPGLAGQCLTTQNVGSAPIWVNCQVSSLSLLPPISANSIMANNTLNFVSPQAIDVNRVLDMVGYDIIRPPAVESIIYKSNVGPNFNWQTLPPSTAGSLLTSGGPTNPPFWATSPAQGNLAAICATVGAVLYFDTPSLLWKCLNPGTSGQLLQTGGAAANPSWLTVTLATLGGVPSTRNVNTSAPLGGGGALSADLTLTCPTCATTTNGGVLSATPPMAISAAGVISITSPLPVANGGTGAATVVAAQTNLGIASPCTRMWPSTGQGGSAWNVVDAYGNAVNTSGTTSQGLQEAINFSTNNGQCLQVYGQGNLALGNQSATLNSTTTVTGLTSTASLLAGDYVVASAGGIPLFTTISSVDSSTQIHISHAATVSATRTLTFTRPAGPNRQTFISATAGVTIPAVEQWSFQAYDVNLTCSTGVNGPCLQFDSAIITQFSWVGGQVVYQPGTPTINSIAVLFAPTNPVPIDGVVAFSDSDVFISNIAVPATGTAEAVVGFNVSTAGVLNSRFTFNELNGTGTASVGNSNYNVKVFAPSASTSFEQNIIDIAHAHLSLGSAILIGTNTTNAANLRHNIWRIGGIKPSGASSAGISSFGSYDTFEIGSITNEEGTLLQGINLQSSAVGNKISYGQIVGATTALIDGGTCNSWAGANGTKTAVFGTTSGCTTIVASATASGTLTAPAATDTLVARATTDTLTNKTLTSPAINTPTISGGTIDNDIIGGTTPAAGTFTTLLGKAGNSATNIRIAGQITAQLTSTGTGADTTEDTLQTFTLPANAFDAVGRCVKIEAWGTTGANANTKNVRLYFGAAIYVSTAIAANNNGWYAWGRVCKTGSNTQTAVATGVFSNTLPATNVTTPNQTDTAGIIIKVTGQNGTAVANDIVASGMTVEMLN